MAKPTTKGAVIIRRWIDGDNLMAQVIMKYGQRYSEPFVERAARPEDSVKYRNHAPWENYPGILNHEPERRPYA